MYVMTLVKRNRELGVYTFELTKCPTEEGERIRKRRPERSSPCLAAARRPVSLSRCARKIRSRQGGLCFICTKKPLWRTIQI